METVTKTRTAQTVGDRPLKYYSGTVLKRVSLNLVTDKNWKQDWVLWGAWGALWTLWNLLWKAYGKGQRQKNWVQSGSRRYKLLKIQERVRKGAGGVQGCQSVSSSDWTLYLIISAYPIFLLNHFSSQFFLCKPKFCMWVMQGLYVSI